MSMHPESSERLPDLENLSTIGVEDLRRKEVEEINRLTSEIEGEEKKTEDSSPDYKRIEHLKNLREQARSRLNELSG